MAQVLIVANLKSYKNLEEGKAWVGEVKKNINQVKDLESKQVIICPSFTLLSEFSLALSGTNIQLGSQNISQFDEGAYTGEINAKQIKDFAQYSIIGHSERRNFFKESDDILSEKVDIAKKYELQPIFCIQDKGTLIPEGVSVVAYEPVFAIGSGNPDTPENADAISGYLKSNKKGIRVLYGGSVTSQNVKSFTGKTNLDGVLVGGSSLDADEFIKIIQNA